MSNKTILMLLFGFISGFTIVITGNSLNFWMAKSNLSTKIIGLLSIVSIPYSFNFLWSPIVDRYNIPYISDKFGHRYSWITILHILMGIAIFFLSLCDPYTGVQKIFVTSLIISFFSSTKDAVLNAWRSEIIEGNKQGSVIGIYIFGYRIGLLLSSSGSIYLSTIISWSSIYRVYSFIVLIFPLLLFVFSKDYRNKRDNVIIVKDNFIFSIFIKNTIKGYGGIISFIIILLFLILYRMPDNFFISMINIFILELDYNEYEIASIGKVLGVLGAIIGGFIASFLLDKISITRSLYIFGIIHAFSFLLFLILILYGHNLIIYTIVIGIQSLTSGMCMASYIAYITSLCHGKYRATQYSLLSSMMGLSRSLFPTISGYIVSYTGWYMFYIFIFLISIPSIIIAKYLYQNKEQYD